MLLPIKLVISCNLRSKLQANSPGPASDSTAMDLLLFDPWTTWSSPQGVAFACEIKSCRADVTCHSVQFWIMHGVLWHEMRRGWIIFHGWTSYTRNNCNKVEMEPKFTSSHLKRVQHTSGFWIEVLTNSIIFHLYESCHRVGYLAKGRLIESNGVGLQHRDQRWLQRLQATSLNQQHLMAYRTNASGIKWQCEVANKNTLHIFARLSGVTCFSCEN